MGRSRTELEGIIARGAIHKIGGGDHAHLNSDDGRYDRKLRYQFPVAHRFIVIND